MADDDDAKKTNQPKRLPNGTFAPGSTGNAGGRPVRFREITELAQSMSVSALNRLYEIYMDPKTPSLAAVTAAIHVLDRAGGKPPQAQLNVSMDGSGGDGDLGALTALLARARMNSQPKAKVISDVDFTVSPNGHAEPADKPRPAPGEAPPPPETVILKRAPDPQQPAPAASGLEGADSAPSKSRPSTGYVRVPGTNKVRRAS